AAGIRFWSVFFLEVGLFWLLPVYCSARLALAIHVRSIGLAGGATDSGFVRKVPAALVVTCMARLLIGIGFAYKYLINSDNETVKALSQSHLVTLLVVTAILLVLLLFSLRPQMTRPVTDGSESAAPRSRWLPHQAFRQIVARWNTPS